MERLIKFLQLEEGILRTPKVIQAMQSVDRKDFVPDVHSFPSSIPFFHSSSPYDDCPQPIGYNATISAPHMHAFALETIFPHLLKGIVGNDPIRILDIGSGSGYLTACFGKIIEQINKERAYHNNGNETETDNKNNNIIIDKSDDDSTSNNVNTTTISKDHEKSKSKAIGIDHMTGLIQLAIDNTKKNHSYMLDSGLVEFHVGDGRLAYSKEAPFNVIHVGASMEHVPESWYDQLKVGGIILAPVGSWPQTMTLIKKTETGIETSSSLPVQYIPLTDAKNQWRNSPSNSSSPSSPSQSDNE